MMKMKKPELLSPAGDWEKLQMAVLYGADAVYLAGTSFGMRSFAGNFDDEQLPRAVRFAHDHGVKVHATVNTMPRWNEAETWVRSPWRGSTRHTASGTSAPSSLSPITSAPRPGTIWVPAAWCWPGS